MATARFAWGIDVGNRALKAIRLVHDGDQIRIDDFDIIEHEHVLSDAGDNRESLIQGALANFAQRHTFKGGSVAIGVSGQSSFARFIKLPPVEPGKIPEIVKFEAIQQIPFPLEDVEWSYQLFQTPDSPEVEVGIFAMRKELVNQTIKYFTDVGLEVQAVQMNPLAVYNALYHDDRLKDGTTMIVDVGAENSDLIIAEGESVWMRSIPIGGNNFTEALVKSFKLKFPKAEELKRNAATSKYGRQILQAMKPVFSDLVGEIQRSIGFYSSTHRDSRIAKVLALGGTFRLPGLQKYLQQNLQLDVARIDRLGTTSATADAKFAATFNENILSAVAAYGLGIQAFGESKITSSLLPEKIRRERMWKEKTKWFAAAAALFVAGTGVAVANWYANNLAFASQPSVEARTKIQSVERQASSLDSSWKQIENSGVEDRAHITNSLAMVADRDVANGIVQEICRAFPPAQNPDALKKLPRAQRDSVDLVGWVEHYQADINHFLPANMKDDEFNQQTSKVDSYIGAANNTEGATPGGYPSPYGRPGYGRGFNPYMRPPGVGWGPGGGYAPPGYAPGYAPGYPPAPTPAAAPGADTATAGGQRGFLVTIQCRTSNSDPTRLVAEHIAKLLRERIAGSPGAPRNFSIERVTIPTVVKIATAFPNGTARQKKAPMEFEPPPGAGAGAAAPAFQNFPANGLGQPNGRPLLPGQNPAPAVPEAPPDPFADPSNPGESTKDDSLVTILAAVMVDPPAKTKVAAAQ